MPCLLILHFWKHTIEPSPCVTVSNVFVPGSGPIVGAGLTGISSTSGAYQEAKRSGFDENQARFYALGIGASESMLSYTIAGISKLGGKVSGNIISKTLDGIDNGIARFALQYGGRILYEGLEEGIQEILDPIFKALASNTSVEYWGGIDWGNVAYSALMGGLSSGVFELSSSITTNYNNNKLNPDEVIAGMWKDSPNTSKNIVKKSQLESVENLSDDDIIKKAKEYLRSPEGQRDTRPYLRHRPSFGKNQEQIVYDNGKNIFGNVYDPSGAKVPWDLSKQRKGQWDMGHIPGQKYSVIHARYVNQMMTPAEFAQWYRDPSNYRPELPSTNRGHKYE